MIEKLTVTLRKSQHSEAYRATVTGSVGRIGINATTMTYFRGLDELTPRLVAQITNITRSDGTGRNIPSKTEQAVLAAILSKLESINA